MKRALSFAVIALLASVDCAEAQNCPPGGAGPPISVTTVDIYASTSGHDMANTCRAAANPCTASGAAEVAAKLNVGAVGPVIHLAAGTYTTPIVLSGAQTSGIANPNATFIQISGAGSGTTTLSTSSGGGEPAAIVTNNGINVSVSGLTITSSNGSLLFPTNKSTLAIGEDVILGSAAAGFGQLHAEQGAIIALSCGFSVTGGGGALFQTAVGGQIVMSESTLAIKFSGTPAYSIGFADIDQLGSLYVPSADISFTGAQTSTFTGSITTTVLTVSSGVTGTLHVGDVVSAPGSGIPIGTTISSFGTGAGGVGTYNLNQSATFAGPIIYTYSPTTGVTGPRYNVTTNSIIETNTGSGTYFPGNAAGKVASNGVYDPPPTPTVAGTTGLGGGAPTVGITSGYSSRNFAIKLTTGTAPAASGSTVVTFGDNFTAPVCNLELYGTNWNGLGAVAPSALTASGVTVNWNNNGVALTGGGTIYWILGHCDG